jgi:hypothetical protein
MVPKQRKTKYDQRAENVIERWEVDLPDGGYKVYWTHYRTDSKWPYGLWWEEHTPNGGHIGGGTAPFSTQDEMETYIKHYKLRPVSYEQTTLF